MSDIECKNCQCRKCKAAHWEKKFTDWFFHIAFVIFLPPFLLFWGIHDGDTTMTIIGSIATGLLVLMAILWVIGRHYKKERERLESQKMEGPDV